MFQAIVRDITLKGLGVVDHPNGKIYFIRGVWIGDVGHFQIDREDKRYGFATLIELIVPSPHRVAVSCIHYGVGDRSCGGCPWLFVSYESQLSVKQKLVQDMLNRAKVLSNRSHIKTIQASPDQVAYRNRAQIKTNGKSVGYIAAGTHNLVDIESCLMLNEKVAIQLQKVRSALPNSKWKASKDYSFFDLDSSYEIEPERDINKSRPFKQANDLQNNFMRDWVASKLIHKNETIVELFCGSGNFTEILAKNVSRNVIAIEGSDQSVDELQKKGLPNVKAISCNLFSERGWSSFLGETQKSSLLFLDPPRDGFELIDYFLKKHSDIQKIIYISCDLHSFVRDCKKTVGSGFELIEVQPLDQFPQTPHIEILSVFARKE